MIKRILIVALVFFFACSKNSNGKHKDRNMYDHDGIWYLSKFSINEIDTTFSLLGKIKPSEQSLKFQFFKKSKNDCPMLETVDFVCYYNGGTNGIKPTMGENKDACAFVRKGAINPFFYGGPDHDWKGTYFDDNKIVFEIERGRVGVNWCSLKLEFDRNVPDFAKQ